MKAVTAKTEVLITSVTSVGEITETMTVDQVVRQLAAWADEFGKPSVYVPTPGNGDMDTLWYMVPGETDPSGVIEVHVYGARLAQLRAHARRLWPIPQA